MSTVVVVEADPVLPREPGPHRRYCGYALLTAAVLAALCVPSLVGRNTNGAPIAAPPDPPPHVGQCRAPIERPEELGRLIGARLVDCGNPHSAEVVSVGQLDPSTGYPLTAAAPSLTDPGKQCAADALTFVAAMPAVRGKPTALHVFPQFRTEVTVPIRAQWDAGQHWYSCQILPAIEDLPVSYTGTASRAAIGPLPAAFGRCAQSIDGDPTPCSEPHSAEQISLSQPIPANNKTDILDCRQLAEGIIGAHDPTFGGALSLTSWRSDSTVACWATATTSSEMVGTLVGWGDRPLQSG
ncbi:MAG: septum formation family protein [Actinomycetota bacterium]|nr:septum formation family protein [Actinomycetota bacterium]